MWDIIDIVRTCRAGPNPIVVLFTILLSKLFGVYPDDDVMLPSSPGEQQS